MEVQVIGARAGKSRIGKRIVRPELDLDERVSITLTLARSGKRLATKHVSTVRAGNRVITLLIPRKVSKGRAFLRYALEDGAGNTLSGRQAVKTPAR